MIVEPVVVRVVRSPSESVLISVVALSSGQLAGVAKRAKFVRSFVVEIVVSHCSDPCCNPNKEDLAVSHKK